MPRQHFQHKELLSPLTPQPEYSDRAAYMMAEMSSLAYLPYEQSPDELKAELTKAGFELVRIFNTDGTQAFLAKRASDKVAVLAFRGTEQTDPKDIIADLNARFYADAQGARIHDGFYRAFAAVEKDVAQACAQVTDHALYVTGHSLGGALAVVALCTLNPDNAAACYTFGSPMVGSKEFDDAVKTPIFRVVNAHDPVPFAPPASDVIDFLSLIPIPLLRTFLNKFKGYAHHGESRLLTRCAPDLHDLNVVRNYSEFVRFIGSLRYRKEAIADHDLDTYCRKLEYWALKRLNR